MKTTKCSRFQLGVVLSFYAASVVLCLPTLFRSGFLRAFGLEFAGLALFYGIFILLCYAACVPFSRLLLCGGCASLAAGNISLALLHFACNQDEKAAEVAGILEQNAGFHIAGLLAGWVIIAFLNWFAEKHPIAETVSAGAVSIGLAGFILVAGGKGNTSTVMAGIQPAILCAYAALVLVVLSLNRNPMPCRMAHAAMWMLLALVLVKNHELGIPIICGTGILVAYFLIYPTPKMSTVLTLIIIGGLGAIVLFLLFPALREDTLNKLTERPTETEHIRAVMRSISTAGVFGNPMYTGFVFAAKTDFSLSTSLHFFGGAWAAAVFIPLLTGTLKILAETKPHGFSFAALMPGFAGVTVFTFITYNALMSMNLLPLIGVQSLFAGTSKSNAILSALLLSSAIYPDLPALWEMIRENEKIKFLWKEFVAT